MSIKISGGALCIKTADTNEQLLSTPLCLSEVIDKIENANERCTNLT